VKYKDGTNLPHAISPSGAFAPVVPEYQSLGKQQTVLHTQPSLWLRFNDTLQAIKSCGQIEAAKCARQEA
jgi:hypothetical protein